MQLDPRTRNIVVVGASAGGVQALEALFRALRADLRAAFLVVLHVPPHTPSGLDKVLGRATPMPVVIARDGQALEAGTVYVATSDHHLALDEHGIRITRGPKESRARPSVDVLFRSASTAFGARVVGVVLSGALDDGTAGLWAVKDRGGLALVQEPAEAMHPSMPESAIEHVEVDLVAPLARLAERIAEAVFEPVGEVPAPRREGHAVENVIALEGNGLKAGVMKLGRVSRFTCPDCSGVLVEIREDSIVRFRCRTGHAFTLKTLLAEIDAAIDKGLWDTLRAVEERVMLLRQMAEVALGSHADDVAARCRGQADEAEARAAPLRELVLDPRFFGHERDAGS